MRLSCLYVTLALALLASSAPLNVDANGPVEARNVVNRAGAKPPKTPPPPPKTPPPTTPPPTTKSSPPVVSKTTSIGTSSRVVSSASVPASSSRVVSSASVPASSASVPASSASRSASSASGSASSASGSASSASGSASSASGSASSASGSASSASGSASSASVPASSSAPGLSSSAASSSQSSQSSVSTSVSTSASASESASLSSSISEPASSASASSSVSASDSSSAVSSSASEAPSSCPMPLAAVAGVKGAGKGNGTTKGTGKGKGARHTKRAGVVHPPGKSDVTLFHGTDELSSATTLKAKVQLSVIKHGDLHDVAVPGVDGGFYMTDSLVGAAQFACRNINPPAKSDNKVYVLEFKWSGASLPVKDFKDDAEYKTFLDYDKSEDNTNRDPTLDAIMTDNAMISSPMNAKGADDLLGKDFWQYAVIKQTAADNNLKYFTTHEVICSTVPPGEELADVMYAVGQKSNPQFPQMLEAVTTCPGNYDWKAAFAKLHASG